MGDLCDRIRSAVIAEQYLIGIHAHERLRERRLMAWQIIGTIERAKLICERLDAVPNAVVEFEQLLPDGVAVKTVWSWLAPIRRAKLVTVHFYDQ
ncbi:MAG: hypothetical protein GC162_02655 [Planctomycetes bacterium]|nr:hypothetical protein [Planctomycetota bacterium]